MGAVSILGCGVLYGVSATMGLTTIAVLACYLPAARAMRIDFVKAILAK
jgi:ABC-type lipoprotein release transport system permease subunit